MGGNFIETVHPSRVMNATTLFAQAYRLENKLLGVSVLLIVLFGFIRCLTVFELRATAT